MGSWRYIFFALSFCFISIDTNGQKNNLFTDTLDRIKTGFTGEYEEHYPGLIKLRGQYKNGLRNGEFIYYRNLGETVEVDSIVNFRNDKKHGLTYVYFEGGRVKSKQNYSNGFLDSTSFFWDESMQLSKIENYTSGVLNSVKKIEIDSSISKYFFKIRGENSKGKLSKNKLIKESEIIIDLYKEFFVQNTHERKIEKLDNYKIQSFIWGTGPKNDARHKCISNVFSKQLKLDLVNMNETQIWIDNLIMIDPNGVPYELSFRKIYFE